MLVGEGFDICTDLPNPMVQYFCYLLAMTLRKAGLWIAIYYGYWMRKMLLNVLETTLPINSYTKCVGSLVIIHDCMPVCHPVTGHG